jgi:MFS family permease
MSKIEWRPWVLLGVLSLAGFVINAATFSSLGVVLPAMVHDLRLNWFEGGLGFTILGAACGSSSLLPAWLIRRFGVRVTLVAGTLVMVSGFLCLATAHEMILYFLGTGLCGVGYQMMALIPGTHVLAAVFRNRGLPFGVYFTVGSLGGVAGPWMVWLINHVFHDQWRMFWQAQVVAVVALGAACAVLVGGPAWLARTAEQTDSALETELAGPGRHGSYRTARSWTVRDAVRTPQFFILLAAYFGHLLVGVTVASLSVAHLTERGVAATVAGAMLSLESLVQTGGRAAASVIGDRIDPRYLLVFALGALVVGAGALSIADSYPLMLLYALGSGLGFGLTGLAVTMLLLNYYGRKNNLEIFSLTCLVGAVSALGPTLGGLLRDATGSFGSTFQIYSGVIAVVFVAAVVMRPPRLRAGEAEPTTLAGHRLEDAA